MVVPNSIHESSVPYFRRNLPVHCKVIGHAKGTNTIKNIREYFSVKFTKSFPIANSLYKKFIGFKKINSSCDRVLNFILSIESSEKNHR